MLVSEPLPIYSVLPELHQALQNHATVILQAPPGAGKSTVLPIELLHESWLEGQSILMLEPRRLATRTVAARMATLLGQELGQTVGYRVRFENRISAKTRLEVVTEGILTRRMQHDPTLGGIGLVIFDEFHERSLNADLGLALCREVQQVLRDDLRILVMSATLDSQNLSRILGNAPIVTAEGRKFPVEIKYLPRDPEGPLPGTVAGVVSRALSEESGDVLVFLPGVGEINRIQRILEESHPEVRILPLYGELSLNDQQAAILPDPSNRKVVLATSIAETSLTIEGIRVVVDSGFSRVPRFDARSGLTRLETLRVTLDSADQRAGRAGRLGPGVCYRLWSQTTHTQLIPQRKPEILEADLAPMLLELAQWGQEVGRLGWVTPPPVAALRQAKELLEDLGAIEEREKLVLSPAEGRKEESGLQLTERGKQMLELPTHPRISHLLIEAIQTNPLHAGGVNAALASDVAAILEERDPLPRESGADLTLRVEALRSWRNNKTLSPGGRGQGEGGLGNFSRLERLAAEWRRRLKVEVDNSSPDHYQVGLLLALAYPDRVARLRDGQKTRYRLSGGRGVRLLKDDALQGEPWLAVAHLDAGTDEGRIYLAAPVHPSDLEPFSQPAEVVEWDSQQGVLIARLEHRIGQVALSVKPLKSVSQERRTEVLARVIRSEGLSLLPWNEELRQWQARVLSLRTWRGEPWPDVSDKNLLETLEDWLAPYLGKVNRREDFAKIELSSILSNLLPWPLPSQLEELAPVRLEVPSGSKVRLEYSPDGFPPVLAVKLQEMFGLADTPTVNEGRTKVMLHLLSPAQRPIQVTQDLRSFWQNTYPEVRKELRGRYNKHPWPEDPWNAIPTKKTNRAGGGRL